jgi:two-component system response regulator QseB
MRVLLVEDDGMIGAAMRDGLTQDGHTVDWLRDGRQAEAALAAQDYDAVLLDLGLPGRSGFEVLAEIREARHPAPVIVVTARDEVADRVRGLDLGADDYLVKPFDLEELAARLRAVTRRRAGQLDAVRRHGALAVDTATREVTLDGRSVELSAREYAILAALIERPGAVLSRSRLEERLYGWDEGVASNAVEVHIHNLRRKLGMDLIVTVRGAGYRLRPAPAAAD